MPGKRSRQSIFVDIGCTHIPGVSAEIPREYPRPAADIRDPTETLPQESNHMSILGRPLK
jgi:hypothetical protein